VQIPFALITDRFVIGMPIRNIRFAPQASYLHDMHSKKTCCTIAGHPLFFRALLLSVGCLDLEFLFDA
jgi:hypothetical protein